MFRSVITKIGIGVALVGTSYAGQIHIGSGANGANGLTASYITTPGGWQQRSYVAGLFSVVTEGSTPTVGASNLGVGRTVQNVGLVDTAPSVDNQLTDDTLGISYSLMNDGLGTTANGNNNHANNAWVSVAGSSTLVVPINNLSSVDWVGIMINDYWGFAGADPTITLHFANAGNVSVVLPDTANGTGPNNATGPIRSATDCQNATGSVTCAGKTAAGGGKVVAAGNPITTPQAPLTLTTSLGTQFDVNWATIWSDTYSTNGSTTNGSYHCSAAATNAPCASALGDSSGFLTLDDIKINFKGNYLSDTLTSISFTQNTVATGANNSRLAVSAITVNQAAGVATPEPGTLAMIGLGLGFVAIRRFRRS